MNEENRREMRNIEPCQSRSEGQTVHGEIAAALASRECEPNLMSEV